MSHLDSPSEQGQLQGAINSIRGIAGLIGPGLFTYLRNRYPSRGSHADTRRSVLFSRPVFVHFLFGSFANYYSHSLTLSR